MQCSCCKSDSLVLREYSRAVEDANGRKNIQTLHLCMRCRIVYVIKAQLLKARAGAKARDKVA